MTLKRNCEIQRKNPKLLRFYANSERQSYESVEGISSLRENEYDLDAARKFFRLWGILLHVCRVFFQGSCSGIHSEPHAVLPNENGSRIMQSKIVKLRYFV